MDREVDSPIKSMRKADMFKLNLKIDGNIKIGVGKGRNIEGSSDD